MTGNLIALSLCFVIEDALHELVLIKSDPSFPDLLRAEADADFQSFMNSDLPKASAKVIVPKDIDGELVLRGPNFCHTARLPADIRHLGMLTESSMVGEDSYDKGIKQKGYFLPKETVRFHWCTTRPRDRDAQTPSTKTTKIISTSRRPLIGLS
jgi:hypothetical protein